MRSSLKFETQAFINVIKRQEQYILVRNPSVESEIYVLQGVCILPKVQDESLTESNTYKYNALFYFTNYYNRITMKTLWLILAKFSRNIYSQIFLYGIFPKLLQSFLEIFC